jgi:lipopolysaccharide transport system permease protein
MPRTVITPHQPWYRIDWREIVEYRDLLWMLVLREFSSIYKQTILGPLWFILQPLATTIVFTVIFSNVAKIETDGIPPFLFYMSGMVLWNYFSGCLNSISASLVSGAGIFGKVYFPRLIVPLSMLVTNLANFALNLVTFLAFYVYFLLFRKTGIDPTVWLWAFPLTVAHCAAVGLGVGLWLAAVTVKYRDLRFALPFLSQLWLYLTPIVYPMSLVSERGRWLLGFNPLSGIVEFNRLAFFGAGTLSREVLLLNGAVAAVLLVTGLLVFNRVQRSFVDTV